MSGDWQAIAAVATSIAAIVTAAMAWYTRRLAKSTVRLALEAAEQTILSRQALLEATRARLDAAAPVVTVAAGVANVFEPSAIGGEANEVRPGMAYPIPRDLSQQIGIRADFVVRNEGSVSAVVRIKEGVTHRYRPAGPNAKDYSGPPPPGGREDEHLLEPGATWRFTWGRATAISDWLETADAQNTTTALQFETNVTVFGLADQGVVDHHRLLVSGKPMVPDPNDHGRCLVSDHPLAAVAYPPTRDYFLSKCANRQLEQGDQHS